MKPLPHIIFTIIIFHIILTGCDTKSTIDDPNKSYFIKFYGRGGDQTGDDLVVLPDGSFVLFGTTKPTGIKPPSAGASPAKPHASSSATISLLLGGQGTRANTITVRLAGPCFCCVWAPLPTVARLVRRNFASFRSAKEN